MSKSVDVEVVKSRIDLRTFAERYSQLDKRPNSAERHGPCPVCGAGEDRFYVARDYCGCRQCGWRGDVFTLVMKAERVDFREALEMVTGESNAVRAAAYTPAQPARKAAPAQDDSRRRFFLENAPAFVDEAHAALMAGGAGYDYLAGRGLSPDTWADYRFGYAEKPIGVLPQWERPCIVIPWYVGGKLTGVRYRMLEGVPVTNRSGMTRFEKGHACAGSTFLGMVYGGHVLPAWTVRSGEFNTLAMAYRSLVLVEGELNAASIWQVCLGARVDVLSMGGQGQTLPAKVIEMASHYRAVLVWMDEREFAQKRLAELGRGFAYLSVNAAGKKTDANDHLQQGTLRPLMAALLRRATPPAHHTQLQWDLEDGGLVNA